MLEIDLISMVAIIISILLGAGIFYIAQKGKLNIVDKVYDRLQALYEEYGASIKESDPEFAKDIESALEALHLAYTDEKISPLEAIELSMEFYPLLKRVLKYIQDGNILAKVELNKKY